MLQVNELGFARLDGIKLPFRVEDGEIEFMDKDAARSQSRGYQYIRMDIELFIDILERLRNGL